MYKILVDRHGDVYILPKKKKKIEDALPVLHIGSVSGS